MADINLVGFPLSGTDALSGTTVLEAFYKDNSGGGSLHVINGFLTYANLSPTLLVEKESVQRGAMVDAARSSGTANLDYKFYWFNESVIGDDDFHYLNVEEHTPYRPIPGGCKNLFCKVATLALVTWQVYWTTSVFIDDALSVIFLVQDGEPVEGEARIGGRLGPDQENPDQVARSRAWSGHALLELGVGWHDIGLCLLADKDVPMTRIHAVSIKVLLLKD
jgi:hypothetical protein